MSPLTAALVCLSCLLATGAVSAEPTRKARPVVCMSYRVIEPGLAVCSDGKRPVVLRRFVEATAPGEEQGSVKVLVGWR